MPAIDQSKYGLDRRAWSSPRCCKPCSSVADSDISAVSNALYRLEVLIRMRAIRIAEKALAGPVDLYACVRPEIGFDYAKS